jgi:hypothetical protein
MSTALSRHRDSIIIRIFRSAVLSGLVDVPFTMYRVKGREGELCVNAAYTQLVRRTAW